MKYRVQIVVTERYSTWVEAENEEAAESMAMEQLNNGKLCTDYDGVSTCIIDTDDGGK